MIKVFQQNDVGRDFVVGDIHGCFSQLTEALQKISFDETKDRLFAVGDLVDRGPESYQVLEWLAKPWFHSIRGNHDQFVIDFMEGPMDKGTYLFNGGQWFLEMDPRFRQEYADEFKKLPILAEVTTPKGVVGLVHADIAGDSWTDFKDKLDAWFLYALWGRDRIKKGISNNIEGIHKVYVGHTPVKQPVVLGNVHYMDMGVCFGKGDFYLEQIN